jgi:serine/threonine-protein kinase
VLVFILLLVSAAVGYVVYQQLGGSGVTVPTLTGNCDHAKAQLTAVGLKGVCKDRESSAAKQGQVVASDPSFGSSADKNSTVTVFIGAGPNTITVPDVHGKSLQDAQAILQGKGFQVDTTTIPVNSAKVNAGDVVGTIPKAGEQEPRGTVIQIQVATGNVLVSSGPQKVSVPPVTNIDKNDAMHMLHDAGLKAAITQQVECTDPAQNNIVQSQDPAAGAQVPQGSTVTIVVLKFKPTDPSCVSPPPT